MSGTFTTKNVQFAEKLVWENKNSYSQLDILTLFKMSLFGTAQDGVGGEGWAKRPPSITSVTYIVQPWNLAQLYLT